MRKILNHIRNFLLRLKMCFFRFWGMDIDKTAKISNKAHLDFT